MSAEELAVVIVGGGKMGEAILSGWLSSNDGVAAHLTSANMTVVNPGLEKRNRLSPRWRRPIWSCLP